MVHFGIGTPQNSVAELVCMSTVGQALRTTLRTEDELAASFPPIPLTSSHQVQVLTHLETALLPAVRNMVKYRTEK